MCATARFVWITGEGPTTKGPFTFSRALDAMGNAPWCARFMTATAVEHQESAARKAEALFEIDDAAARAQRRGTLVRRIDGQGGLCITRSGKSFLRCPRVLSRCFAGEIRDSKAGRRPERWESIPKWLEWIARQMRGKAPQATATLMFCRWSPHRRAAHAAAVQLCRTCSTRNVIASRQRRLSRRRG